MLSSTLVLKDASDTSHNFVQIDTSGTTDGIVRLDSSKTRPEKGELKIRHQPSGSKLNIGRRHTLTLITSVKDDVNNVRDAKLNISLEVPDHSSITNNVLIDLLHMGFDAFVSTGSFTIDSAFLASILLGES